MLAAPRRCAELRLLPGDSDPGAKSAWQSHACSIAAAGEMRSAGLSASSFVRRSAPSALSGGSRGGGLAAPCLVMVLSWVAYERLPMGPVE